MNNSIREKTTFHMTAASTGPVINSDAYATMIEKYMDKNAQGESFDYHEMANAIRFLSIDAI